MPRDWTVYITDIISAIGRIEEYVGESTFAAFAQDLKTVDAVVRNLEVIGEASKKIPTEIRTRYPSIEWKKISGLRDILIHEYFGIDIDIIWDIVKTEIPRLKASLKATDH